jgi:hypothetical protein
MEWIAESLRIWGFINREHVMAKFGISTPQASKDLNEFMRKNPEAMHYNPNLKKYVSNTKDSDL